MHHFVGYSEEGAAIYKDGCSEEWCVLESFVGQVIDLSPPGDDDDHVSDLRDMVIARVGAILGTPHSPEGPRGGSPVAQRQGGRILPQSSTALNPPTMPAPTTMGPTPQPSGSAAPYWACYGRMEGGYYANNPTPGSTFEQDAFTREAVQPGEEIAGDYYMGPTPIEPFERSSEARSGILRNLFGAAGRFLTGQWAHGNAGNPIKAGDVGSPQRARKQQEHQAAMQAARDTCAQRKTARRRLACQRSTEQRRNACCLTAQEQAAQDQGGGGGGGGGGDGGGYCCYPEEGYPQQVPPGYCFVPYSQNDQEEYSDEGDEYDDCGECYGVEYAGQAPAGLGEGIGGALGGALGLFIGAPELTAPIGAMMGGAIQGAACGGHPHAPGGSPGFSQQRTVTKSYIANGARTQVHGAMAPDGLFDPASGESGPITTVIQLSNDLLRKNGGPGAHFVGVLPQTSVGQTTAECEATQIFDDTPRFQAAGFWDDVDALQHNLADHVQNAADWTYDQGEAAVHYAVGGGPGAKDFGPYSQGTIQSILQGLRSAGYDVEGANPYDVNVKQHGVKLAATVHPNGIVTIAIASSNFYVTHDQVWEKVDPLMPAAG